MILPLTKTGKSQIALTLASSLRRSRKLLLRNWTVETRRIARAIRSATVHKVAIVREAPALVDVRRVSDICESARDVWSEQQQTRLGFAYHLHAEV